MMLKNVCSGLLALIIAATSTSAFAGGWWWKSPEHGFAIQVSTPNGIAQKSGSAAHLSGKVLWVDAHSKGQQPAPKGILDQVEVRAFFPDLTQEVTSQLALDKNHLSFDYTTPPLSADGLNTFIVQIGRVSPHSEALGKLEAKIERRIQVLDRLLAKDHSQKTSPDELKQIAQVRAVLDRVAFKIRERDNDQFEVLSEARVPLQVDNSVAGPSLFTSLIGGFRFELGFGVGSAIEGEKTLVQATITNVRRELPAGTAFEDQVTDQDLWSAEVDWQGVAAKTFEPQALSGGGSLSYSFTTEKLSPSALNELTASIYKAGDGDSQKQFGNLTVALPVAEDAVAPLWAQGSTPDAAHPYVQTAQPVSAQVSDAFGLLDPDAFHARLTGTTVDGATVNGDVTNNLTAATSDQGQHYSVTGDINPLLEGDYTLSIAAADLAGNDAEPTPLTSVFHVDRTPPAVTLGISDHVLTNNPSWAIPITVVDRSPTTTTVFQNGTQIAQFADITTTVPVTLKEGINTFEVDSFDAAGNEMPAIHLTDVVLDTIPPLLSNLDPTDNQFVNFLSITASGTANEPLSGVTLNGEGANLQADKMNFDANFVGSGEGPVTIHWAATDLAGNTATRDVSFVISLRALNSNLLSIVPDLDGQHLWVKGAIGAVRPGLTAEVRASLFNSGSAVAADDGTFAVELANFNSVEVSVFDPRANRTESADLTYGGNTTLAGTIRGPDDKGIVGVTVRVANTALVATTDGTGTFAFTNPVTGDQTLMIDGSTAQLPPDAGESYGHLALPVTIGVNQTNVIKRPIYLTPLLTDSATPVEESAPTTVTDSVHAPGVALQIAAGTALFPDGTHSGSISIQEIPAKVSTLPVPSVAVPENVVALEPSGTTFSKPVDLTLPNSNELPPGVEVVIMTLNSNMGRWEIGGAGVVSEDGTSIISKPGQGIAHFSEVYATPVGPTTYELGSQAKPGADLFDGAVTSSISLPSFKTLGEAITPKLLYKSAWAKPTPMVTNIFDIPKQEVNFTWATNDQGTIDQNHLHGTFEVHGTNSFQAWYQPDYITAQFFGPNLQSQVLPFNQVPQKSIISYSVDLKSPDTGAYPDSGLYPYVSHYEVHLKQLTISSSSLTETDHIDKNFLNTLESVLPHVTFNPDPNTVVTPPTYGPEQQIKEAFPSDLVGNLYIQNESHSAAGSGWKIGGYQRIRSLNSSRVMIEEADGSVASYAANDTITTVYNANGTGDDLNLGVDLSHWPDAYVTRSGSTGVDQLDLSQNPPSAESVGNIFSTTGTLAGYRYINHLECTKSIFGKCIRRNHYSECHKTEYNYSAPQQSSQLLALPDGRIFGTDSVRSLLFSVTGGSSNLLAGMLAPAQSFPNDGNAPGDLQFYCANNSLNCQLTLQQDYTISPDNSCGPPIYSSGSVPSAGDSNGSALASKFNHPTGIAAGYLDTVAIADTGNHRIRQLDLTTGQVTTLAGTGGTNDIGADGDALGIAIYKPQALAYDSKGNLYIAGANGLIRKYDYSTKKLTRIAGTLVGEPRSPAEDVPANQMILSNPVGLAIDQDKYLYVADRGAFKVWRINLADLSAQVVAGNGAPTFNGDNQAALNASMTPTGVAIDTDHNLLIVDGGNNRIRRVAFVGSGSTPSQYSPATHDSTILSKNTDGTWTRSYRNGSVVEFDQNGLEINSRDRAGRNTQFQYDSYDRLIQVIEPTNQITTYSYDGNHLASITDPSNRTTRFVYDGDYLSQVIFPDNTTRSYQYNEQGLLEQETNERNKTTQYQYNQWNRLAKIIRPDLSEIAVSDMGSTTASSGSPDGEMGQLKGLGSGPTDVIVGPSQQVTTFNRDDSGYISKITDPSGVTTRIDRDLDGRPTALYRNFQEHDPARTDDDTWDSVLTSRYSPEGDLIYQEDSATGLSTSNIYNKFGQLITNKDVHSTLTTNTYDPQTGLLTEVTNSLLGTIARYEYNAPYLLKSAEYDALNEKTSYAYDSAGNVSTITYPIDATHTASTQFFNDPAGNITSKTDADQRTTQYSYDAWNRVLTVTSPQQETTTYKYTETGKLASIKDAYSNETDFVYDDLDRMIAKKGPLGFILSRQYDANDNVIYEKDQNGNEKKYRYDSLNRLIEKDLPDDVVTLTYNAHGDLTKATNSVSEVDYNLDASNGYRLISTRIFGRGSLSDFPDVTISYGYDQFQRKYTMQGPAGVTNYGYDDLDRLTSILAPSGQKYQFSYDTLNRVVSISRLGSSTALAYEFGGALNSITHSDISGGVISSFIYTNDPTQVRTAVRTPAGDNAFLIDPDGQLTSATHPDQGTETYTYDANGNRTSDQNGQYTYDSKKQRLLEDYRYIYLYDNNGNLIEKQAKGLTGEMTKFAYSSENQLTWIGFFEPGIDTPVKEVNYFYDPTGRRIQKEIIDHHSNAPAASSYTRKYVYDGKSILTEYDGANQILANYAHSGMLPDDVLGVEVTEAGSQAGVANQSGRYEYLKDAIGSITDIADDSGSLLQHYVYSSFGVPIGITDANGSDIKLAPILNTAFAFTGREFDSESGLYYYRARYYDANIGRFLQRDPAPGRVSIPQTELGGYSYAANNPQTFVDPTGENFVAGLLLLLSGIAVSITAAVLTATGVGALVGIGLGGLGSGLISASFDAFENKPSSVVWRSLGIGTLAGIITGGAAAGLGYIAGQLFGAGAKAVGAFLGAGFAGYGLAKINGMSSGTAVIAGIVGAFVGISGSMNPWPVDNVPAGKIPLGRTPIGSPPHVVPALN